MSAPTSAYKCAQCFQLGSGVSLSTHPRAGHVPAALTKLILKSRVDLLRDAAPVSHGPGVDVVHLAGVRVEAPVVASTEDVDLVLLSPPYQSGLHGGCRKTQLHQRGGTRYPFLAIVNPVLRIWRGGRRGKQRVRSSLFDTSAVNCATGAGALAEFPGKDAPGRQKPHQRHGRCHQWVPKVPSAQGVDFPPWSNWDSVSGGTRETILAAVFSLFVEVITKKLAGGTSLYPANSVLGGEHLWACTGVEGACECQGASYRNQEEIAKLT